MLRRKKRLRMEADLTTVFKYALGIYVSVGNISCLMCNRWAFVDAVKAARDARTDENANLLQEVMTDETL